MTLTAYRGHEVAGVKGEQHLTSANALSWQVWGLASDGQVDRIGLCTLAMFEYIRTIEADSNGRL